MLGRGKRKGERAIPSLSHRRSPTLSRTIFNRKRETGDARCITGMMDDPAALLCRKRSLSIYKKLPSRRFFISTTRTILWCGARYLDLHKFVHGDAFTPRRKKNLFRVVSFRIIVAWLAKRRKFRFKIRQSICIKRIFNKNIKETHT